MFIIFFVKEVERETDSRMASLADMCTTELGEARAVLSM